MKSFLIILFIASVSLFGFTGKKITIQASKKKYSGRLAAAAARTITGKRAGQNHQEFVKGRMNFFSGRLRHMRNGMLHVGPMGPYQSTEF